jgi:hypothetical protein
METSRQTYDDKLTAVESDLKKLGNLQQEWTIEWNALTVLYINDDPFSNGVAINSYPVVHW